MEKEVKDLLEIHTHLEITPDGDKVKCGLTGHEMPCKTEAVRCYVAGKKYKRALERHECSLLEKYSQHLEPSKKKLRKNQLFCKLTWRHLNNDPKHITQHINGRRFQRALTRFAECQAQGEPYKPLTSLYGVKRQREETDQTAEHSGSDVSGDEAPDDMEDLYPAADFASSAESQSETDDSDFEFEDLETMATQQEVDSGPDVEEVTSVSSENSVKRKQKEQANRNAKRRKLNKMKGQNKNTFKKSQNHQHTKNRNIQQPDKNKDKSSTTTRNKNFKSKQKKNKNTAKGNG